MARPKKVPDGESLKSRLEEALMGLVQEEPLERISIGELVAKAGCSRSAFYYHYDDIYDLFDGMVARYVPVDWIAAMAGLILSGCPGGPEGYASAVGEALASGKLDADRMRLLLGSRAGDRVRSILRGRATGAWSQVLGVLELEGDERLLFEFAFNGLLGVLAYRPARGGDWDPLRVLGLMTPELPAAFASCLEKGGRATARRPA